MTNLPLSQLELGHEWAEITIMRMIERQKELGVYHSGDLQRSFDFYVTPNPQNMLKEIFLEFLYYGRFPDMGVGRGMGIESVKDNRSRWATGSGDRSRRKPKKWYSPVFTREYNILMELLMEHYQYDILKAVRNESGPIRLVV